MPKESVLALPHQLECYRNKLESSIVAASWITPINCKPMLTDSKLGGFPYLPKTHLHPKDTEGKFMPLLAQINFAEVPSLPHFPNEGLLQFFISYKVCNSIEKKEEFIFQQDFKVRYFSHLLPEDQLISDFSYLDTSSKFPIQTEMKLEMNHTLEPVSATDYRREHYFKSSHIQDKVISADDRTFDDIYFENFLAAEHKIGGYPYFLDSDTRKDSNLLKKYDTLLLQIVSNDEQGIMYGDSGVIKFFIDQHHLENLDFSSIYFIAEQF